MGRRGSPPRRPPPCRFRGGGGSVSSRTDALHHCHAALRCRITYIMYPELLSVINVVQAQGALCAPIGGQPASILRVLQPGIVFCLGRGRGLIERDVCRPRHRPPSQPSEMYVYRPTSAGDRLRAHDAGDKLREDRLLGHRALRHVSEPPTKAVDLWHISSSHAATISARRLFMLF
jgi:hypothetical protein